VKTWDVGDFRWAMLIRVWGLEFRVQLRKMDGCVGYCCVNVQREEVHANGALGSRTTDGASEHGVDMEVLA
jgi:hypothetical protein